MIVDFLILVTYVIFIWYIKICIQNAYGMDTYCIDGKASLQKFRWTLDWMLDSVDTSRNYTRDRKHGANFNSNY